MMLKAARAWQVRPSEFQAWSVRDKLSAVALLQQEALVGPCGHPHDVTTGDLEGWFEVDDTETCWACAAMDQYRKDHAEQGSPPGAIIRVVDTRTHNHEE